MSRRTDWAWVEQRERLMPMIMRWTAPSSVFMAKLGVCCTSGIDYDGCGSGEVWIMAEEKRERDAKDLRAL